MARREGTAVRRWDPLHGFVEANAVNGFGTGLSRRRPEPRKPGRVSLSAIRQGPTVGFRELRHERYGHPYLQDRFPNYYVFYFSTAIDN